MARRLLNSVHLPDQQSLQEEEHATPVRDIFELMHHQLLNYP